jgi:hypothetical protein
MDYSHDDENVSLEMHHDHDAKHCCFRRSTFALIALPVIQSGHGERQLEEGSARPRDDQELKDALGGLIS